MSDSYARLLDVLQSLDDANPDLWTADGRPIISAVQRLAGFSVSREQLDKIGRMRKGSEAEAEAIAASEHPTPVTEAEAVKALADAENALAISREDARAALVRLKAARAEFSTAMMAFMHGSQRTFKQVHQDHMKREAAYKLKHGVTHTGAAAPAVANSAIDRVALATAGGSNNRRGADFRRGFNRFGTGPGKLPSTRNAERRTK